MTVGVLAAAGAALFSALSMEMSHGVWALFLALLKLPTLVASGIYNHLGDIGQMALALASALMFVAPILFVLGKRFSERTALRTAFLSVYAPPALSAFMVFAAWIASAPSRDIMVSREAFFVGVAVFVAFEAAGFLAYGMYRLGGWLISRFSGAPAFRLMGVLKNQVCPVITVRVQ